MEWAVLDPSAHGLAAGELEAVFLPGRGMLCASLRHRGAELLRRVEDLAGAAARGASAGIPLLHPFANRLAGLSYTAAGREVTLDRASPLLHFDANGLPIHGVPWSRLAFTPREATRTRLVARLEWADPALLALFPFRHALELATALDPGSLTVEVTLTAGRDGAVPISFGFHPYLGLPDLPRPAWRLVLPPMRRLALDAQGLPTGAEAPFPGFDAPLGDATFDDGFALDAPRAKLALAGAGRRLSVELLEGYTHAQVYAPREDATVALEPMTAPTGALGSGRALRLLEPGASFRAVFRIGVGSIS